MKDLKFLKSLIQKFSMNIAYYKDSKNNYNENSCRLEYIDQFLEILGWDVANEKNELPQYREVVTENYSIKGDRPDYTLTLRGVAKFFVEAKKPSVDISSLSAPAIQARKYGWNANHKISVLTNFEYLAIYDTSYRPMEDDNSIVARYRLYHYSEYVSKFNEIAELLSRQSVYSGSFDKYTAENFQTNSVMKQPIDEYFLEQINNWRILLSNELYNKDKKYKNIEILNDITQEFIDKIIFLRICEDRNLPLYYSLQDTIDDESELKVKLEELFHSADKRYNSGLFSGSNVIFDLSSQIILKIISDLYYPQSPYMFNIIEPNLLGKIYEIFLTEQLVIASDKSIKLEKKRDCLNRSIVSTPNEIVKYMVGRVLSKVCADKTPEEILSLKIADIACGSGVFLEEAFEYIQNYCVQWYIKHGYTNKLVELSNGRFKLPLTMKKALLCSCIYGIDLDIHAVEVAKFSLLIKLIANEDSVTVSNVMPILPDLKQNLFCGNSLVTSDDVADKKLSIEEQFEIVPFDWVFINSGYKFDVILGNPPYVNTEDMHMLLTESEFGVYKAKYSSAYKQFDKYFLFIEEALKHLKDDGWLCYIVPNKFMKIASGEKLRKLLIERKCIYSIDDFGDTQLFEGKTTYCAILTLNKSVKDQFTYASIDSVENLWLKNSIQISLNEMSTKPWRLTTDIGLLKLLEKISTIAKPITDYVDIFNGIQTSAETPVPVYWFKNDEIISKDDKTVKISRKNNTFVVDKALLKPYFKPQAKAERGLDSYSVLETDKYIIFPYNNKGELININDMERKYYHTYKYLLSNYDRLLPKNLSEKGRRDVPGATENSWYQYGRTQALTSFINTPKLIVGVLSKKPMYVLDKQDVLIASGGTAGYCAISKKENSQYELEYLQAWFSNPITEKIIQLSGSNFEGGFIARGTFTLKNLPFIPLDLSDENQHNIYTKVVELTREIYAINDKLTGYQPKRISMQLEVEKKLLINQIEALIKKVYMLDFSERL